MSELFFKVMVHVPLSTEIKGALPDNNNNIKGFVFSADSDQPGLTSVFIVHMKKAKHFSYPPSTQPGFWSDWADFHGVLSLSWVKIDFFFTHPKCGFPT